MDSLGSLFPKAPVTVYYTCSMCRSAANGLNELLEVCFEFPFNLICQMNNGLFIRLTMARTHILGYRRGPETGISAFGSHTD